MTLLTPIGGAERAHERSHTGDCRIGLGCMALTGIYGRIERRDAIAVIHRALDLGIGHFDTAELYGPYVNEELLAEALGNQRAEVRIATKFGYKLENSGKT
jgi:aryl-alcohol dehydrogenase-like predicted oxidoreductase